jgi:hypothetical protein
MPKNQTGPVALTADLPISYEICGFHVDDREYFCPYLS